MRNQIPIFLKPKSGRACFVHRAMLALVAGLPNLTFSQGILRFTFEEVAIGETPPYVSLPPFFAASAKVYYDAPGVTAYEGHKLLAVTAGALITPPTGELINAFTVHLYMPSQPGQVLFSAGGVSGDSAKLNEWQTISGSFSSPAQNLLIAGGYNLGQTFPANFYVDDIRLVTIPEPRAIVLLVCGALVLLRFKSVALN